MKMYFVFYFFIIVSYLFKNIIIYKMEENQSEFRKNSFTKRLNFLPISPKKKASNIQFTTGIYNSLIKKDNINISKSFLPITKSIRKKRKKEKSLRINNVNKLNEFFTFDEKNDKDNLQKKIQSISKNIIYKYGTPYMEHLYKEKFFVSPFMKNQKPTFYNYYQTTYILDKKKSCIYSNYKDHKLFLDNQEFFFKYFTKRESKIYLSYLFYFIYAKDHFVQSNKLYCLKKDRNHIKEEFNEIIINNIFGAQKIISAQNYDKIPNIYKTAKNIDQRFFDKKEIKKLSRVIIPKYYLNIKPIIYNINYLYVKDLPSNKIPNTIPNYIPNDTGICSVIKNHVLKDKYSIYVINYKEFAFLGKKEEKGSSSNLNKSKDNIILNSFISTSSKNEVISSERNKANISSFQSIQHNHNIHNVNKRVKNDTDIADVENLAKQIVHNEFKKEDINKLLNINEDIDNKNEKDIFLSTLKKPFIGNRSSNKISSNNNKVNRNDNKIITFNENKSNEKEEDKRIDITKAINEKIKILRMKNEEIRKKYPLEKYINHKKKKKDNVLNFYLNYDDEYNKENNKKFLRDKIKQKNILTYYFPDRFLNAKKYKEFLINSPFLKTLQKINKFISVSKPKTNNNIKTLNNTHYLNNRKGNSFSPNTKVYSFKETYKFMIGMNKTENRNNFKKNIFNKTNVFYQQFKTLNYATKNRSNFKKSGAFAFSSFSGSNYDKTENEWKEVDTEIHNSYNNSFFDSNIMKKIKSDHKKQQLTLKNCTTFKEIAKCPNIYV